MSIILEVIREKFLDDVFETNTFRGDLVVVIRKNILIDLMKFLKKNPDLSFNVLMDLSAVDYLEQGRTPRYDVVYHLFSVQKKHRLRVKVGVEERELAVPSLTPLWPIADWFEREAWDMFGIQFEGHPNLTRILTYESFEGHPLRKDYPVEKRQPLIDQKTDEEVNRPADVL
jgi:NADH-quinone oxidoreductase subunit C